MVEYDSPTRNPRFIAILAVLALFLAGVFWWIQSHQKKGGEITKTEENAPIAAVVVTKDLRAGTLINPSMVAQKELPSAQVPQAALLMTTQAVGRVTTRAISADQVLTQDSIISAGAALGPTYMLATRQMRAVTINADLIQGVAGYVKPGDHVDVIATFDKGSEASSKVILQDIEVLAVGRAPTPGVTQATNSGTPPPSEQPVTLAVTIPEAEQLMLADIRGKVRMALRPAKGGDFITSRGTTEAALSGIRGSSAVASAENGNRTDIVFHTPDLARMNHERAMGNVGVTEQTPSRGGVMTTGPSRSRTIPLPPNPTSPYSGFTGLPLAPAEHQITVVRGTKVETVTVPSAPKK